MPTVSKFTNDRIKSRAVGNVSQNIRSSADAFGAQQGKALEGMGNSIGKIVDARLEEMQEEQRKANLLDFGNRFDEESSAALYDPEKGFYSRSGRSAFEAYKDEINKLKEAKRKTLSDAPDSIKVELDKKLTARVQGHSNHMSIYAAQQRRVMLDESSAAFIENRTKEATLDPTNSDQRNASLSEAMGELQKRSERSGWGSEVLELEQRKLKTKFHGAIIGKIAESDLGAAMAYFEEHEESIDSKYRDKITGALRDSMADAKEKSASDLELSVRRGEADADAVEVAFDSGVITGAKRVQMHGIIDQRTADEAAKRGRQSLIDSEGMLDPSNKDHRQAVDEAYSRLGGTSEVAVALAAQTNLLPSDVLSGFRTAARGGTIKPETMQLYGMLADQAPAVLQDLPEQTQRIFDSSYDLVRGGMKPKDAFEMVRENMNKPKSELEVIAEHYKEQQQKTAPEVALQSLLDSDDLYDTEYTSGAPTPPAAMVGEFERITWQYFTAADGDIEEARKLAWKKLQRAWQRSDINGDGQIMRYSPEAETGANVDILTRDLNKSLSVLEGLTVENVRVVSDVLTARAPRGGRSYALMVINENGLPEPLLGENNLPLRWLPDPAQILQEEHEELLEAAKRRKESAAEASKVPTPYTAFSSQFRGAEEK